MIKTLWKKKPKQNTTNFQKLEALIYWLFNSEKQEYFEKHTRVKTQPGTHRDINKQKHELFWDASKHCSNFVLPYLLLIRNIWAITGHKRVENLTIFLMSHKNYLIRAVTVNWPSKFAPYLAYQYTSAVTNKQSYSLFETQPTFCLKSLCGPWYKIFESSKIQFLFLIKVLP